jgi:hypothetical protein
VPDPERNKQTAMKGAQVLAGLSSATHDAAHIQHPPP